MNRYSIPTLPFRLARMLALTGTLAAAPLFAQQPPADSAPPSQTSQSPAPVERRGPSDRGPQQQHDRRGFGPREDGRGGPPSSMDFGLSMRLGPMGAWWKNPSLVQRLALTPEQVRKMDDIFHQNLLQLVDLKANLEKQNLMLEPLLSANPIDTAKAQLQIDKVAEARADLEKANARMLLSIRSVLTPDQWTKLRPEGGHFGSHKGPGAHPVE